MPKRHTSISLKKTCLVNIARNMDKVWGAEFVANYSDLSRLLYVVGPLDDLTGDMIEELLVILSNETKTLKRHHLYMLIHSRLNQINLSRCNLKIGDAIISMISARCSRLVRLNLSNCAQVSAKVLLATVHSLTNLQFLDLARTKCNDQIMTAIGTSCPKLRELDVNVCKVTDAGIAGLLNQTEHGLDLESVAIEMTEITTNGALMLLQKCKNLRRLKFEDILLVIYLYNKYRYSNGTIDDSDMPHKLQSLEISSMPHIKVNVAMIEVLCQFCPYLTEICLHSNITDEIIQPLKSLKYLRSLELANSVRDATTFEAGVFPILDELGNLLVNLVLIDVNHVDIGIIGAKCLNLRSLRILLYSDICGTVTSTLPQKHEPSPFSCLTKLKIDLQTETSLLTSDTLTFILQASRCITELYLCKLSCLTDDVFDDILTINTFPCLTSLILVECHNISEVSISKFISMDNPLANLNLWMCKNVTRRDFDNIEKFVNLNHFDLDILWA